MPRVPTAGTTTDRIAVPALGQPERTAALAQGVARIASLGADQAFEFAARREAQRSLEEQNRGFAEFSKGVATLGAEVSRQDDIDGITSQFDAQSEVLLEETLNGISSPQARAAVEASAIRLTASHRASVAGTQFKREQVRGRAELEGNLKTLTDTIVTAPNEAVRDELTTQAIATIEDSDLLLAEEKGPAVDAFLKSLDVRTITSLVDLADAADNPSEALGHLATATAILEDPENTPQLSPGERTKLRRAVEAEKSDHQRQLHSGATLQLSRDIQAVQDQEDADVISARIDAGLKAEVFTEDRAIKLDSALRSRLARLQSADNGAMSVEIAIRLGIPLDPKDQKSFDAFYEERFLQTLEGKTPDEVIESTLDLVESTDMLPSVVEQQWRIAANSDSPQAAAEAAQQYVAFRDASPQAVERIDSNTRVFFENINEAIELNVDPKEALRVERERQKLNPSVVQGRNQLYAALQLEGTDGQWLVDNAEAFEIQKPGLFTFNVESDQIDVGMQNQFASNVKRFFALDPNLDRARERSLEDLARVYGTTEVGGEARNMYLAPELMYPALQGDSAEITKQLITDLRGVVPEVEGLKDAELSNRLVLAADFNSLREEDANGKLTPGYSVFLKDEDGAVLPLPLMDKNHVPVRFFPDDGAFEKRRRAEATLRVQEAKEESARRVRIRSITAGGARRSKNFVELGQGIIVPAKTIERRRVEP